MYGAAMSIGSAPSMICFEYAGNAPDAIFRRYASCVCMFEEPAAIRCTAFCSPSVDHVYPSFAPSVRSACAFSAACPA